MTKINIDNLIPSKDQVRIDVTQSADWASFVESIRTHGIQQKPKVRPIEEGKYQIIYGHRRIMGARSAGLEEVDCDVVKVDEHEAHRLTIVENHDRDNLSPIEMALQIDGAIKEFGIDESSKLLHMSIQTLLSYRRMLSLPLSIQTYVHNGVVLKSAVPAILAYFGVYGEQNTISFIEKHKGDGSHTLVTSIESSLKFKSNGKYVELYGWNNNQAFDFPYDKAFPLKETLKPKKAKMMSLIETDKSDTFDKLVGMIEAGVDVISQPWLIDGFSQIQIETVCCYYAPPACDNCPFKVQIANTVSCSMKACLRRKRDSWHYTEYEKYIKNHNLTPWKQINGGKHIEGFSKEVHEKYSKMIAEKDTLFLRAEPKYNEYSTWPGTNSKYVRLVDISDDGIKKGQEEKEAAAERRSSNISEFFSPENVRARKIKSKMQLAYFDFYVKNVVPLIETVLSISLAELIVCVHLSDETIHRIWPRTKITSKNRLSLYRQAWLINLRQTIAGYYGGEDSYSEYFDTMKEILKEMKVAIPEDFDATMETFMKERRKEIEEEVDTEKEAPEEEFEEEEEEG